MATRRTTAPAAAPDDTRTAPARPRKGAKAARAGGPTLANSPADRVADSVPAAPPAPSEKVVPVTKAAAAKDSMTGDDRPRAGAKRARPARQQAAWRRAARPDALDFRDRWYVPGVGRAPAPSLFPPHALPVKHQGSTNACTGFALSLVVEHLLRTSGREADATISPYMLYSMARRYDEFPGSVADEGSSLRGALKGWFKHGSCRFDLFGGLEMPPPAEKVEDDWWYDAVRRPLGAYYRIAPTNLTDMHVALHEVGVLYVSCGCHEGWDEGVEVEPLGRRPTGFDEVWEIPVRGGQADHPGHAFAIVGYNERGFLVHNSWGEGWGSHGMALLTYDDWLHNAMDCWVAQLGVVTQDHKRLAEQATLVRAGERKVSLAANPVLRDRQISPYVLNMGNDGMLSPSGLFRTTPDDVKAIAGVQLERARSDWALADDQPLDVCLYAHGGLVGEKDAAETAARWIPALYDQRIYPIFLMWETDFWSTLKAMIGEALAHKPPPVGGMFGDMSAALERWWNQRLERALAQPGTAIWGEMKENADLISRPKDKGPDGKPVPDEQQPGAVLLYRAFRQQVKQQNVRLHFVGHSAGSIVGCRLVDRLIAAGLPFDSVACMAPAVRLDLFEQTLLPRLKEGTVARYQQFSLTERAEEDDPTCGPYKRSLLHLVSESFEGGKPTPILGLARDAAAPAKGWPNTTLHLAPGPRSAASTHGGFDDDDLTMKEVIRFIRASRR